MYLNLQARLIAKKLVQVMVTKMSEPQNLSLFDFGADIQYLIFNNCSL